MPTVAAILETLFAWAPAHLAWERDNIGLMLGDPRAEVRRALLCLDVTPEIVREAIEAGADLVIAHHPLIFHPLRRIDISTGGGAMLRDLLAHGIAVVAMHTNADASHRGLNQALAGRLGLRETAVLAPGGTDDLTGAETGIGVVGDLERAEDTPTFLARVKRVTGSVVLRISSQHSPASVCRVAVTTGAGASLVERAAAVGADAYVTADLTHHVFLDHGASMLLVDAGHHETEHLFVDVCADLLRAEFADREKFDILPSRTDTNPIRFV
jgi:dinuclear metal center YbgI/SA1388 family protein